jgi:hypothetical protein
MVNSPDIAVITKRRISITAVERITPMIPSIENTEPTRDIRYLFTMNFIL